MSAAADLRFREAVHAEILRRALEEKNFHMSREEAEDIGAKVGLPPGRATRVFLGLRGDVWMGDISRASESEHFWDMAHFYIPWFQDRGELPIPLPSN